MINASSVCIITNGCNECRLEAAEIEDYLVNRRGFQLASDCAEADMVVFRGCSFTQDKEDLSREILKEIDHRKRPDAKVFSLGCVTRFCPELRRGEESDAELVEHFERLSRFDELPPTGRNIPYPEFWDIAHKLFGRTTSNELLCGYCKKNPIGIFSRISARVEAALIQLLVKYRRCIDREVTFPASRTFCIRISTGCCGACSYCSIRLSRGRVTSKPIDMVVEELRRGLKEGYKDFALLGTDIGDYGKDLGLDLADLLESLVAISDSFKLRLRNVNPRWLIASKQRLCEILKSGKVVYILTPIESGSNRLLKMMNRGYTAEDFIAAVESVREANPKVFLSTQIMVGFPGETDEDYDQSVQLLNQHPFDYFEVYRYTPRRRTAAADLPGHVPDDVASLRYRKLIFKSFFINPLRRLIAHPEVRVSEE